MLGPWETESQDYLREENGVGQYLGLSFYYILLLKFHYSSAQMKTYLRVRSSLSPVLSPTATITPNVLPCFGHLWALIVNPSPPPYWPLPCYRQHLTVATKTIVTLQAQLHWLYQIVSTTLLVITSITSLLFFATRSVATTSITLLLSWRQWWSHWALEVAKRGLVPVKSKRVTVFYAVTFPMRDLIFWKAQWMAIPTISLIFICGMKWRWTSIMIRLFSLLLNILINCQ